MSRQSFIEGLEGRTLLSVTPAPVLFNKTIRADRAVVNAELLKFRTDILVGDARLDVDRRVIRRHTVKGDTTLVAPFAQLQADAKSMRSQLLVDRLTESANAKADESVILKEIVQIKKDKGKATAEATDHAALLADRIQLQNDLVAGLDSRVATRTSFTATIDADTQNIVTAAGADVAATAAFKAAVGKFSTDRDACLTALQGDLTAIANARQQLVADLTAAQST